MSLLKLSNLKVKFLIGQLNMVTYYKITTKTAFSLQLSNKMKVQLNTIFSVKWMFIQLYMFILVHVPMSGVYGQ